MRKESKPKRECGCGRNIQAEYETCWECRNLEDKKHEFVQEMVKKLMLAHFGGTMSSERRADMMSVMVAESRQLANELFKPKPRKPKAADLPTGGEVGDICRAFAVPPEMVGAGAPYLDKADRAALSKISEAVWGPGVTVVQSRDALVAAVRTIAHSREEYQNEVARMRTHLSTARALLHGKNITLERTTAELKALIDTIIEGGKEGR